MFHPEMTVLTMFQIENENFLTVAQNDKMFKIWKITKTSYSLIKEISIKDNITNAIPLNKNNIGINCEMSKLLSIWNLNTYQCVCNIRRFSSFFLFFHLSNGKLFTYFHIRS